MFFDKIKENLRKTKEAIDVKMSNIFADKKDIEEVIDEIEETLILSDVGYETSRYLTWTNYNSDGYSLDYNSTYINFT